MQGKELANDRREFSFRADVQADEDSEHVRVIFPPDQDCSFRRQFFGAMAIWYGFAGNVFPVAKKPVGLATCWSAPGDHTDRLR
jgi:hypothetical protein